MFSTTWAVDSAEAMVDVSAAQHDLEAACASDDELKGVVCALLAFEAPQAHSPDAALGVAVVCAVGRTVSLNALRRGARRYAKAAAGRLCAQPAMLVLLRALPPASLGLAEALQLPSLTPCCSTSRQKMRAASSKTAESCAFSVALGSFDPPSFTLFGLLFLSESIVLFNPHVSRSA